MLSPRTKRRVNQARLAVRRPTAPLRPLPDFVVIGTQRGGTSSLFSELVLHPQVQRPLRKEIHYFNKDYARGSAWYRSHFQVRDGLRFEATPSYLFRPEVPARVARDLPATRFVALLREPVARAVSHHRHMTRLGHESLDLEQALEREQERTSRAWDDACAGRPAVDSSLERFSYAARGLYAEQLGRWFAHVPRERVLVLLSEDYYADPDCTVREVLAFVGGDPDLPRTGDRRPLNADPRGGQGVPDRARDALQERFAAPNSALAELLGREVW